MIQLLRPLVPVLFVLLWSTGFIFARVAMDTGQPASILSIRMALAASILIVLTLLFKPLRQFNANWKLLGHSAIAGILIQAVYLGGVFAAIKLGTGAGLSALIVGIQPVLTVILASLWLSEKLTKTKLIGIAMGFVGVVLVTSAWQGAGTSVPLTGVLFCIAALLGITLGTLYQKKFCQSLELHINIIMQYVASILVITPFALAFESYDIDWTPKLIGAMAWLVLVLSIGTSFLLMWLIKVGEAGRVSTMFFLVPPVVAIEAWFLFDEPLTLGVIAGTTLCIAGVAIVSRSKQ